jgi:anaphase-promoting complex subunit 2
LPHLGTVNLELELEDRTVSADVAPLEAAFIELFSEKSREFISIWAPDSDGSLPGVWTLDELTSRVGSVDRSAALKALVTWVDMGILKEDVENTFRLLEVKEERTPGARGTIVRPGKFQLENCSESISIINKQLNKFPLKTRHPSLLCNNSKPSK